jgi:hypothetical protein
MLCTARISVYFEDLWCWCPVIQVVQGVQWIIFLPLTLREDLRLLTIRLHNRLIVVLGCINKISREEIS